MSTLPPRAQDASHAQPRSPDTAKIKISLKVYSTYEDRTRMENTERIAGGFFIIVLMILTLTPFNNDIQAAALAEGATEIVIAFALVFPILWVGLIFSVAGFTGYDIFSQME